MSSNNGNTPTCLDRPDNGAKRKGATTKAPNLSLSKDDQFHLEQYVKKVTVLRDHVAAVALGYETGLLVFGGPGTGKNYNTMSVLRQLGVPFIVHNSHMTARAVFEALKMSPDAVHVFEDMEYLFSDKDALCVLRAALFCEQKHDNRGPQERLIVWAKSGIKERVMFRGGLIFLFNRGLPKKPEAVAIGSRIPNTEFLVTQNEMRALMRALSNNGYKWRDQEMEPAECREVCEFVLEKSLEWQQPPDLRLLFHGFHAYLQYQNGDAANHWHNLVTAQLRRELVSGTADVSYCTRDERRAQDEEIVREILVTTPDAGEQVERWKKRTGKSRSQFYKVRKRVLGED